MLLEMAKKPNNYALNAHNHPISVGWRVDYDYLKKLTPEQKTWLAGFTDAFYSGDFRKAPEKDWPTSERRASYTRKNVANSDCYHGLEKECLLSGLDSPLTGIKTSNLTRLMRGQEKSNVQKVVDTIPSLPVDSTPTPAYLNTPEYKKAREAYRANLNQGRRECAPKASPTLNSTHEALNKIVQNHVQN